MSSASYAKGAVPPAHADSTGATMRSEHRRPPAAVTAPRSRRSVRLSPFSVLGRPHRARPVRPPTVFDTFSVECFFSCPRLKQSKKCRPRAVKTCLQQQLNDSSPPPRPRQQRDGNRAFDLPRPGGLNLDPRPRPRAVEESFAIPLTPDHRHPIIYCYYCTTSGVMVVQ